VNSLHRLHPELDAYTVRFEDALLEEIRDSYQRELAPLVDNPRNQYLFEGGQMRRASLGEAGSYLALSYDTYPLLWLSNNDARTHAMFRRFFEALAIESELRELLDCRQRVVFYCGFLVVGDHAPAAQWHSDYASEANAFTLITPLFPLQPEHGHLLYRHGDTTERYEYALNEAILFGDKTPHTTEPYPPAAGKRVLVSLTFGTDKMKYWPRLRESLESQAHYFTLPCGHLYGSCDCVRTPLLGRLARWLQQRLAPLETITE
jgi:hypothetical protein